MAFPDTADKLSGCVIPDAATLDYNLVAVPLNPSGTPATV